MPTLIVNDLPHDIYERLEQLASARRSTASKETVRLLQQALQHEEARRALHEAALGDLRRRRWTPPPGAPASVELLREDRER